MRRVRRWRLDLQAEIVPDIPPGVLTGSLGQPLQEQGHHGQGDVGADAIFKKPLRSVLPAKAASGGGR